MIDGLPPGSVRYVSYAALSKLPQITTTVVADTNFDSPAGRSIRVTGIPLEVLAKALGQSPDSDLIDALCADRYRSHYPVAYIAAHHPIFALRINGLQPTQWAVPLHQYDPGPYFITHAHFVSSGRILAHDEQPQIPSNVLRLNFSTTAATYGAITPHGNYPPNSPVMQGFAIAKQNCLRCHYMGPYGGTKSGQSWHSLAAWASEQPDFFQRYIHNPQAIEPKSHMEGSPGYDAATLAALTAYFRTFSESKIKAQEHPHK
jgi:cytochrome c2